MTEHDSVLGRWRHARWVTSAPLSDFVAELWDLAPTAFLRSRGPDGDTVLVR